MGEGKRNAKHQLHRETARYHLDEDIKITEIEEHGRYLHCQITSALVRTSPAFIKHALLCVIDAIASRGTSSRYHYLLIQLVGMK